MSTPVVRQRLRRCAAAAGELDDVRLPLTPSRVLARHRRGRARRRRGWPPAPNPRVPAASRCRAQGSVDIARRRRRCSPCCSIRRPWRVSSPAAMRWPDGGFNRYRADVTVGVGLVKARYEAASGARRIDAPRRLRHRPVRGRRWARAPAAARCASRPRPAARAALRLCGPGGRQGRRGGQPAAWKRAPASSWPSCSNRWAGRLHPVGRCGPGRLGSAGGGACWLAGGGAMKPASFDYQRRPGRRGGRRPRNSATKRASWPAASR